MQGSMTALVTPFVPGAAQIDEAALRQLVDWQIREGTDGLVPCGTTGESPTLDEAEAARAIRITVEEARGRVPVIAGCGTNSTRHTVDKIRKARELGADAALVVAPYYNRPTSEGLFLHYRAAAREGGLPVVLYNIPGRTAVDVSNETIVRLFSELGPALAGVKEATGSIARTVELLERTEGRLDIFAGDDAMTLATLAVGGRGVVSVASNVVPGEMARLVDAFFSSDWATAQAQQRRLGPLMRALFMETNPIPVKAAMALLGRMHGELRLPLVAASTATVVQLRTALSALGALGETR